MKRLNLLAAIAFWLATVGALAQAAPALSFKAQSADDARAWQRTARQRLFALMMGGQEPARCPLDAKVLRRIELPGGSGTLEELTLQTLPDRRAHVWLARPTVPTGKIGAILALNGHGGSGEQVAALDYGNALRLGDFMCSSAESGVTCTNTATGHAVKLNRQEIVLR